MRTLYLDCFAGIAGDMLLGAMLACGVEEERLRQELARLNVRGWKLRVENVQRNGIGAVDVSVDVEDAPHHHRHLADIEEIITSSSLPQRVQERAVAVFRRLAEAEAKIHGTTPQKIHFHEVGALDAIVDITGACIGLELLGVEQVVASPLPMGRGFVECAHGILPLPAPAVLELLRGVPAYGVDVEAELVTPTGAALVTTLAQSYGPLPVMAIEATGYGAGKRQLKDRPNLLRAILGTVDAHFASSAPEVAVLETNLDDVSPQFYEVVTRRLFDAGALDVYLTPVQMKKERPGVLLTVLADPQRAEALADVIFRETTTMGVRFHMGKRLCLEREWQTVQTEYGAIRVKIGRWKGAPTVASPEYEDVKAAASASGAPVYKVYQAAQAAYNQQMSSG
ncbi:MAG: nickel pincer cofactor biosynthesis protein LarC [Chthonomonadales bacterium]